MLGKVAATTMLTVGLISPAWGQTGKADATLSGVAAKALGFFERIEGRNFDDYLKRVRLPKVSESFKARVLANLARGEAVRPSTGMRAKLATLEPVLRYHEREAVVETKVINLTHALVGLQGRAVLLISEKALHLLTADELRAAAAHEMAHEYFWGEYQEARQRKQYDALREIELLCDGIAVVTLERLGLDPADLVSGIEKIHSLNTRIGNLDRLPHPSPDERFKFIRAMTELVKARNRAASALVRQ